MSAAGPRLTQVEQSSDAADRPHRFAHEAMATVFEVLISGGDVEYARQAAGAVFDEIDHLEADLSRFRAGSDVSRINALAPGMRLRVGVDTYDCLKLAARIWGETGGAFDVTVGALVALWNRAAQASGAPPSQAELDAACARTGMRLVDLDPDEPAVTLKAEGINIDLGGIGKGFAVDRAVEVLREWSLEVALVHGGGSTVRTLGSPPEKDGWRILLGDPEDGRAGLGEMHLKNRALSGSGVAHRPHILDPRTGRPVTGKLGAWAACDSAAVADALSTAFTVMSPEEVRAYCEKHPGVAALVVSHGDKGRQVARFGSWGAAG